MADLDFIDSIVDQCLGSSGNPAPPQQQQRPLSARNLQAGYSPAPSHQPPQQYQPNASNVSGSSPPPMVPPRQQPQQQQYQQQQPMAYAPPTFLPQQQQQQQQHAYQPQPSASAAMPSPVAREQHYQSQSMPHSHRSHHNNNNNDINNNNGNANPYAAGGGYTTGGGRPHEYVGGGGGGAVTEYNGSSNPNNGQSSAPLVGGDAALRRIQMWEEKKRIKQAMARREQQNRGDEECTFRPNVQAARDSVLAAKLGHLTGGTRRGGGGGGTVGFGYGGGNNGLTVGGRLPKGASLASPDGAADDSRAAAFALSASQAMTPSRLYKDNKAWGYDSFIDRQTYAREMRKQQEEDAAAVFALKNPDRPLRTTVPEPFEFGNKGRKAVRKALEAPSAAVSMRVKREQPDFYADDSSAYDPHHSGSGAFFGETDYHSRQYRASDALAAPSVPAGLFSLHASNMMLEYAGTEGAASSPHRQ